ncbi:MAG: dipeptide epimerase [Candidatus Bathyarchaeia archaeon]|nr:dipeptide epimerase [Candidatus Bathyarchaeota archaeon]
MKITRIRAYNLNLEFHEPLRISYTTFTQTSNVLVIVDTDSGISGYGEAAPLTPVTGDSQVDSIKFLQRSGRYLIGEDPTEIGKINSILNRASEELGLSSSTSIAAVDSACYDIAGKILGKPIYQILGSEKPRLIPNTVTLYLGPKYETEERVKKILDRYKDANLSRLKLKLSGDPNSDLERVMAVAELYPGELTLDANQSYNDPDSAADLFNNIYDLIGSRVVLIEQPCPKEDLAKLRQITVKSKIPIFADESAATIEDVKRIVELRAAKGVNLKLQKVGGITPGLEAVRLAKENGLQVMVGCMVESGVGIAYGANFAAGVENIACSDLDTDLELKSDIVTEDSRPRFAMGSRIPSGRPGLGVTVKEKIAELVYTIE